MKRTLAMLLVLAIFCAFFFVALEAEHDCAGDDCLICGLLTACLRLVRFTAVFTVFAAAFCFAALCCRDFDRAVFFRHISLIEQKVKLSD